MKDIGQHTSFWVACFHRNPNAYTQSIQIFGAAPQLELRHDPNLVSGLQQRPIAFNHF